LLCEDFRITNFFSGLCLKFIPGVVDRGETKRLFLEQLRQKDIQTEEIVVNEMIGN